MVAKSRSRVPGVARCAREYKLWKLFCFIECPLIEGIFSQNITRAVGDTGVENQKFLH